MNPPRPPRNLAERCTQLERIAGLLLDVIEHGKLSTSERLKLLRSYQETESLLERMRKRQHEEEVALLLRWSDLAIDQKENSSTSANYH